MPFAVVAAVLASAGSSYAQTSPAPSAAPQKGYAEVVAQSAFGNVTSQSLGVEVGVAVVPGLEVFVDAGHVRDAAPSTLGVRAQTVAGAITPIAGSTSFQVKQPLTFGIAGLKYVVPTSSGKVAPYVLAGGGAAKVSREVTFSTPSGDVSQFVTLGSDLSGSETKGMLSLGAGVGVPLWHALIVDLQYRYGRVFTSDGGLNVNRAGIGVGVRF